MYRDTLFLYQPTTRMILMFIKEFFSYHVYENCRIGGGNIYYGHKDSDDTIIAKYSFDAKTGLPIFDIKDDQRDAESKNNSYRKALGNLLGSYALFDTSLNTNLYASSNCNKFLGIVSYRMPLSTDKKEYEVSFNIETYKIHLIDTSTKVEHSINYFGLTRPGGCEHPIEHEVSMRCQAYFECSRGFCKD